MAVDCRIAQNNAAMLAACALAVVIFPGQHACAKDKVSKGELEHTLVGQVVTSKIQVGDKARPSSIFRQGSTAPGWPVHTIVDVESGEIRYRVVEDLLGLETTEVHADEIASSFGVGTSFRISAIRIKGNRIEIKLKELGGGSAEVSLMMGGSWQPRHDAASVQVVLGQVFEFGQSGQQMEAEKTPPQSVPGEEAPQAGAPVTAAKPAQNVAQATTPELAAAAGESLGNQVSVPPNPPQQPEQREPATPESARPAFIDCNAVQHIALFSLPDASSSPVATLQCGEKVVALGQHQDWARVRTQQGVEGYAYRGYVNYGEPSGSGQVAEGRPETSENEESHAPDMAAQGSPAPQATEQQASNYASVPGTETSALGLWEWGRYWVLLLVAGFTLVAIAFAVKTFGLKKFLLRPLTIILIGLTIGPTVYCGIGSDPGWYIWTACMSVVTAIAVLFYAPWYALLTFAPLVWLYLNGPGIDTDGKKIAWGTFWLWVWSTYPLVRNSLKARKRREEAKRREEELRKDREQQEEARRQTEREEQQRQNKVAHQRASAEREYGHVADRFADLVKTCGAQAEEMLRATHALGGRSFTGMTVTDIVTTEAMQILSVVAKAEGEVPIGLAILCQAIYGRLRPDNCISWEQHQRCIDDLRRESFSASLPLMVISLHAYDQSEDTRMAAKAAGAYLSLVNAACSTDDNQAVAAKIVRDRYVELLRPYFSASSEGGDEPGQQTSSDRDSKSSYARCQDCPKYYPVLQVNANATKEEIKSAYRDLAKIYHSDRLQSQDERVKRRADDLLKGVNEAYAHFSQHWRT